MKKTSVLRTMAVILAIVLLLCSLTACSEADMVNTNLSKQDELVVTCKVGPDEYKKNYIYLNEYTLYVVEDITGTHTDPYHYKLYFHTNVLPTVEVKP